MAALLVAVLLVLGLGASVKAFQVSRRETPWERCFSAVLPLLVTGAVIMLIERVASAPVFEWNEAKLAPIVAMTRGYELYQDPQTGVMTGWIYGPIAALIFLPVSVAKTPAGVMIFGAIINCCTYLLPAGWVIWCLSRGLPRQMFILLSLFFFWYTFSDEGLTRCASVTGADGPGLGLAACAVAAIYHSRSNLNLAISAVCMVLCCWTKQSYLTLPFALLAFIAIVDGWKRAMVYAACSAAAMAIISAPLIWYFGGARMYFHMVELPALHPLREDQSSYLFAWFWALMDLLRVSLRSVGLLLLALSIASLCKLTPRRPTRAWICSHPWSLLLLVALFLVPSSIIPYSKVGGFLNTLACAHFFLLLAACGALAELYQQLLSSVPLAARMVAAMLVLLTTVIGANDLFDATRFWPNVAHPNQTKQAILYRYVRSHPGSTYCPWNPLTTLLVDGKLYHFEWGVMDRYYAKRIPSPGQLASHVPVGITRVVYVESPPSLTAHNALGAFRKQVEVPELPDMLVYSN